MTARKPVTLHCPAVAIEADGIGFFESVKRLLPECTNALAALEIHVVGSRTVAHFTGVIILHVMRKHGAMFHGSVASHTSFSPDRLGCKKLVSRKAKDCRNDQGETLPHDSSSSRPVSIDLIDAYQGWAVVRTM
jgi:hypothetical protein